MDEFKKKKERKEILKTEQNFILLYMIGDN